jgi:hypothetical protein
LPGLANGHASLLFPSIRMTHTHTCAEPSSAQAPPDAWWEPKPPSDAARIRGEKAILQLLSKEGQGTRTELCRRCSNFLDRDQLSSVIAGLIASNQINVVVVNERRGRPVAIYGLIQ